MKRRGFIKGAIGLVGGLAATQLLPEQAPSTPAEAATLKETYAVEDGQHGMLEFVAFDRTLPAAERAAVESYLATKWAGRPTGQLVHWRMYATTIDGRHVEIPQHWMIDRLEGRP